MSIQSILLPVFVQVALIFAICFRVVYARNAKLGGAGDPEPGRIAGDSLRNQFEIPVLFFALVPLAILTREAGYLFIVMEWIFVLSRIAHAFVHVTSNRQPARGLLWLVGVATLLAMWIIFALRILFPPTVSPL
ncbi:MAG: MAPEG family protein [Methylocella sp.]